MDKKKTCILIVGMHRSGSSLLAGSLQCMGYFLGKTIMPANENNPKGYHENLKCWELNEKLLSIASHFWDSIAIPDFSNIYFKKRLYIEEIRKILAEDFLNSDDIAIKDPRISLLLPFWIDALIEIGYNVKIILSIRKPSSVAQSLLKRDFQEIEKSCALYSIYVSQVILDSPLENLFFFDYNSFLNNPLILQDTFQELGITPKISFDNAISAINELVTPELNHSENENLSLEIPVFPSDLYRSLMKEGSIQTKIIKKSLLKDRNHFEHYLVRTRSKIDALELQRLSLETSDDEIEEYKLEIGLIHEENTRLKDEISKLRESQKNILDLQIQTNFSIQEVSKSISGLLLQKEVEFNRKERALQENYYEKESALTDKIKKLKKERSISTKKIDQLVGDKERVENELSNIRSKNEQIDLLLNSNIEEIRSLRESLNEYRLEFRNLRKSISNRIGFGVTWPFRMLLNIIFGMKTLVKWGYKFISIAIIDFQSAYHLFSFSNIRRFWLSLKTEPTEQVYINIRRKLKGTEGILKSNKNITKIPIHSYIDEAYIKGESVFISGWAISINEIESVGLLIDDREYQMIYGFEREDLAVAYPDFPNSSTAGFFLFAKLDSYIEVGKIKIYDKAGYLDEISIDFKLIDSFVSLTKNMDMSYLKTHLQYPIWSVINEEREIEASIDSFLYQPLISILTPVYNVDKKWLDECIESVLNQTYSNWELCIYDDASTRKETIQGLTEWQDIDDRIKISFGKSNLHISGASNIALEMSNGQFVGLLDHDDVLNKNALYEVVRALNKDDQIDFIYSDEDKISTEGIHCEPHFKPSWSPETLENMMYVGHFLVFRKSILEKAEGFRVGYEGSQDFDLVLRVTEITNKIHHISKILYHWRILESSSSGNIEIKGYAKDAAVKALRDRLKRKGRNGIVEKTSFQGLYKMKEEVLGGQVAIIIPFHNNAQMTINCLISLEKSSYNDYEVILISNNSDSDNIQKVTDFIEGKNYINFFEYNVPFNYSKINNWAVSKTNAKYLLFLNNDTLVINPDWIERLLEHVQRDEIGAVGAKLLYEDNTIQHAGVIMCIGGVAGHGFRFLPDDEPGYCGYAAIVRNCSAVTGACLMVRREVFVEVGGFNEEDLHVAFNDVDLCLKILSKGYRNIYTPNAKLYHLESKTRPKTINDMSQKELNQFRQECDYMKKFYPNIFVEGDKYYNANLTLRRENYALNI